MTAYTFSQLIDFTRTSSGTFVGSNGLIQTTPQSRNLLTWTQEFDNAFWAKTAMLTTANATVAPDGTATADKYFATNSASTSRSMYANLSPALIAASYAFSFYAKAAEYSLVRAHDSAGSRYFASFDLSNGTVVAGTTGGTQFVSAAATAVGNGWYRCTIIFTGTAALYAPSIVGYPVGATLTAFGATYAGDGVSGIFIWGAQLEQASTATDYTRNVGGLFPARFDYDPVTLAPRGILIEEQRANLLTWSEQFDNAGWTKLNATVTANNTTAPDGALTADKLIDNATSGSHVAFQAVTFVSATTYTVSCYAKVGELSSLNIFSNIPTAGALSAFDATFNLSNGTVTSVLNGGTATITLVGNGWYRCTVTNTVGTGSAANVQFRLVSGGNTTYVGTGQGLFLWAGQCELGAFATSYIPTVASQVTRTADQASIVAPMFAPWYNQSEGTLVAEITSNGISTSSYLYPISMNESGAVTNAFAFASNAGSIAVRIRSGGADSMDATSAVAMTGGVRKMAAAARANDFAFVVNAGTVITDATGAMPVSINRLDIFGSNFGSSHIRRITYYPVRLSDLQLQALTS